MRRPVLFVCAALLALSACGDVNEDRGTVPDPTTSPSSPTPSPAPTMPDQAKENSPEGAAAFVSYYVDLLNHAAGTGDVEDLSRASGSECDSCRKYIEMYASTYEDGGYFEGGTWEPSNFEVDGRPDEADVFIKITAASGISRSSAKSDEIETEPYEDELVFEIARKDEWRVREIGATQ